MRDRQAALDRLGLRVQAVSFESWSRIAQYQGLPYPILRDPRRETYRAFGLGRTELATVWGPETLWYYARKLLQGGFPEFSMSDQYQLGGDAILRPDLSGGWIYRSRNPADRPPVDSILQIAEAI